MYHSMQSEGTGWSPLTDAQYHVRTAGVNAHSLSWSAIASHLFMCACACILLHDYRDGLLPMASSPLIPVDVGVPETQVILLFSN